MMMHNGQLVIKRNRNFRTNVVNERKTQNLCNVKKENSRLQCSIINEL